MTGHLIVGAGQWWTVDGRAPDEPLVFEQLGPTLRADRSGCVALTGWRHLPQDDPVWMVVVVPDDEPPHA